MPHRDMHGVVMDALPAVYGRGVHALPCLENNMKKMALTMRIAAFWGFSAVLAAALASGCVPPRQSGQDAAGISAPAEDPFAAAVAHMASGASAVMGSPYGRDSVVRAGEFYTSGLGMPCRRATVLAQGVEHRLAVCRDNGSWQTFGAIFENGLR